MRAIRPKPLSSIGSLVGTVALTVALSACGTSAINTFAISEDEELQAVASPANLASLSNVVQRNPNDPQAYNMRGSVLGRARRYDEAIVDFTKAIQLDPNYAQAYANRALAYREMKKLDLAFNDYTRAIQIDPGYSEAYVGRGIVQRARPRTRGARRLQQGGATEARQRAGLS
jgi:tetratricopeptide (TPR) repeat protein